MWQAKPRAGCHGTKVSSAEAVPFLHWLSVGETGHKCSSSVWYGGRDVWASVQSRREAHLDCVEGLPRQKLCKVLTELWGQMGGHGTSIPNQRDRKSKIAECDVRKLKSICCQSERAKQRWWEVRVEMRGGAWARTVSPV